MEYYKIDADIVKQWLMQLWQLTEIENLENALSLAKQIANTDADMNVATTLTELFRAEFSGQNKVEVSLVDYYSTLTKS